MKFLFNRRRVLILVAVAVFGQTALAALPARANLTIAAPPVSLGPLSTPGVQVGNTFSPAVKDASLKITVSASEKEPFVWLSGGATGCATNFVGLGTLNVAAGHQSVNVAYTISGTLRKTDGSTETIVNANSLVHEMDEGEDGQIPICAETASFTQPIGPFSTPGAQIGSTFTPALQNAKVDLSVFAGATVALAWVSPGATGCAPGFDPVATLNVSSGSQQVTVWAKASFSRRNIDGSTQTTTETYSIPVTSSQGDQASIPICLD